MKKFLALTLALVMSLSLVACGGQKTDETPADSTDQTEQPADTTEEYKIAMITDYGDITDQSFNQTTYEACKAFCRGQRHRVQLLQARRRQHRRPCGYDREALSTRATTSS